MIFFNVDFMERVNRHLHVTQALYLYTRRREAVILSEMLVHGRASDGMWHLVQVVFAGDGGRVVTPIGAEPRLLDPVGFDAGELFVVVADVVHGADP